MFMPPGRGNFNPFGGFGGGRGGFGGGNGGFGGGNNFMWSLKYIIKKKF